MSFKQRLARLSSAPRETTPGTLAELRERMQQILARDEPASEATRPEPEPSFEALGFEHLPLLEQSNTLGGYWARSRRLSSEERVGRLGISGAFEADAGRLALLALDARLSDVDFGAALYLDTETTGLGGSGVLPFLIGLGYFEDGRFLVEQLMLGGPEQEAAALHRLRERVDACQVLVSFNGKSFDWPLLVGRFVMNRLGALPKRPHLDLLHLARRVHKERLQRHKLTALESEVLGFVRLGDIDGAEVSSRYLHYLRSGDASGLQAVLEHNHWDVLSMAALVALYGQERPALEGADFVGIARTLKRARQFEQAREAADIAIGTGAGAKALWARAEIEKAVGDRLAALRDFESCHELESNPTVRLELAKLYEHFSKRPDFALSVLALGTDESQAAHERRQARLSRKLAKRAAPKLPG